MNFNVADILMPPALALLFLLFSLGYGRSIRGSRPFTPFMRGLTIYGTVWALGMGYIVLALAKLCSPDWLYVVFIAGWALLLGFVARRHHWRNKRLASEEHPKIPARAYVSVGMPFLGVLISLIVSAIQWEFVAEGQGHLWQALAWTAALAASIWLARQNRRVAVVMALRVFLVLGVIGAIGHPSIAVFVALGFAATVYFLIGRLWPKDTGPPVLDFEALSRGWRGWRRP